MEKNVDIQSKIHLDWEKQILQTVAMKENKTDYGNENKFHHFLEICEIINIFRFLWKFLYCVPVN